MKIPHLTFALAVALFLVGCSKSENPAAQNSTTNSTQVPESPEQNAVNSFKSVVKFLSSKTNDDGGTEFLNLSYDVEKTDSLISPITGVITYTPKDSNYIPPYNIITCHFAFQDGKWVLKSIESGREDTQYAHQVSRVLSEFLGCPTVEPIYRPNS